MLNCLLRIFFRAFDRFFRRVTDLAKNATCLSFRIDNAEFFLDQCSHTAACPNRVGITKVRRIFCKQVFEFFELLAVEFRPATGPRLRYKGLDALLGENFSPKLNGRKTAAENFDDLAVAITLCDQLAALNAT